MIYLFYFISKWFVDFYRSLRKYLLAVDLILKRIRILNDPRLCFDIRVRLLAFKDLEINIFTETIEMIGRFHWIFIFCLFIIVSFIMRHYLIHLCFFGGILFKFLSQLERVKVIQWISLAIICVYLQFTFISRFIFEQFFVNIFVFLFIFTL